MVVEVFAVDLSPPCRAVYLACEALGISYKLNVVDILKGEQKRPEFRKMNPQHTVPTMRDGDVVLAESNAIMAYLANKYAPTSAIYPKDPAARALVDSRLYFSAHIFSMLRANMMAGETQKNALEQHIKDLLEVLNVYLEKSPCVAGPQITLADLALLAIVTSLEVAGFDMSAWSHLTAWLAKMKKLPYYSVNENGLKMLGEMMKARAAAKK